MLLALLATAHAETSYALAEAGITLQVGPGWHMSRWSDWDFTGRTLDSALFLDVWTTSFQQTPSADSADAWAKMYATRVQDREKLSEVKVEKATVETIAGRPTIRVDLSFALSSGGRAVSRLAGYALDGKLVHLGVMAAAPNAGRAASTLQRLVEDSPITRPPVDLGTLGSIASEDLDLGLPAGWRAPLPSETSDVSGLFGRLVAEKDAAKCLAAIHPLPGGETDLMLVCPKDWRMPILDEKSFAGVSKEVLANVFGKATEKVPAPEPVALADRTAMLVRPSNVLRLGIVPWHTEAMVVWVAGQPGHEVELDAAATGAMKGIAFKGADKGAPNHGFGDQLAHTLSYNPTHPLVLASGAVCLAIFGGLVMLIFRKREHHPTSYMH